MALTSCYNFTNCYIPELKLKCYVGLSNVKTFLPFVSVVFGLFKMCKTFVGFGKSTVL